MQQIYTFLNCNGIMMQNVKQKKVASYWDKGAKLNIHLEIPEVNPR